MAGRSVPQTPRRSRRFQPLATPFLQRQTTKAECTWDGEPIYARSCNPELDLMQEERDEGEEVDGEGGNGNEKTPGERETIFYSAFTVKRPKAKPARGKQTSGDEVLTFRLGDTITVETDTLYRQRKPPSVAVIMSMWEVKAKEGGGEHDSSKMRLRVHWFLRPSELPAIREKREYAENEIYYSLTSSDTLVPSVIVSRCAVSSHKPDAKGKGKTSSQRPYSLVKPRRGPTKRGSSSTAPIADFDVDEEDEDARPSETTGTPEETFYCSYAINSQRGLYYNFKWDCHRAAAVKASSVVPEDGAEIATWGCGKEWDVDTAESFKRAKKAGPPPKKRAKLGDGDSESSAEDVNSGSEAEFESESDDDDDDLEDRGDDEEEEEEDEEDMRETDDFEPRTPSKKRKRGQTGLKTPRKKTSSIAQPTPHSKRALKKRRKLKGTTNGSPRKRKTREFIRKEPSLDFKADISRLPQDPWLRAMHVLHVGNRPEALPCRGGEYEKVFACVEELLEEGSGGCVYISGVPGQGKTATVHSVIGELKEMAKENAINPFTYVEINGLRIPEPSVAYTLLWEAISTQESIKNNGHMSANQSLKALTHHFGRSTRGPAQHSYVVLMDELDQLVTPKQDVIYNFFNWPTLANSRLIVVAVANTMDLPERVMTGRVRSRLGMTRINFPSYTTNQLVEIVEARLATIKEGLDEENAKREVMTSDAIRYVAMTVCRITGDARRVLDACRRVVEFASVTKITAKPNHATKIVKAMQSSPTAGYLQDCSLHERIMLAALIRCVRREGVEEIKWDDVQYQHLNYIGALTGSTDSQRKPSVAELTSVLDSLVAARAVLLEDGPSVARKPTGERRVLLNIEQIEVERVLSDVGGQAWKNVLSA